MIVWKHLVGLVIANGGLWVWMGVEAFGPSGGVVMNNNNNRSRNRDVIRIWSGMAEATLGEAITNPQRCIFPNDNNSNNNSNSNSNSNSNGNDVIWNGRGSGGSNGGDADRYYVQGMQLDEAGQARAAAAAFLEAATLYQCYLDFGMDDKNPFEHVVDASSKSKLKDVLAYACLRLAHLNQDALGDDKAATRLYKDVIHKMNQPSDDAYDGIGTSLEASNNHNHNNNHQLLDAIEAYRQALQINPDNGRVKFHLAVLLERLEIDLEESERLMEQLRRSEAQYACLVDSWGYVRWHTRRQKQSINLYRGTRSMLQLGLDAAMPLIYKEKGLVCEFGVARGRSLRLIQEICPLHTPIHGFDTFTGLPMAWGNVLPAGAFSTNGVLPSQEEEDNGVTTSQNVYFHIGLFQQSIPDFLKNNNNNNQQNNNNNNNKNNYQPLAFANIDCFLYSSTLDILEAMHARVVPGTVFVFDDYMCHPSWRQDEFRAWRECCKRFGWQYEYLGFSLATRQAVVRITSA